MSARDQSPPVHRHRRCGHGRRPWGLCVRLPHLAAAATGDGAPELNAWVVVQPDDMVVIRIARSEMGQGTLTGLAQMVAEELECDWAQGHHRVPHPGPEPGAQARVGRLRHRRQPRHPHQPRLRAQGRRRRPKMMLVQAAADGWKVPAAECTVDKGVISHSRQRPQDQLRQGGRGRRQAHAAHRGDSAEGPQGLEAAGQAHGAPGHGRQDQRQEGLRRRPEAARHAERRRRSTPARCLAARSRAYNAAKLWRRLPGVKKVVPVGDNAVAVVADTWWHAKKALDALPVEWDFGPNAKVQQADFNAVLKAGLDAQEGRGRQQQRRHQGRAGRCGAQGRGGLRLPAPEPRHHGADERHGQVDARALRGLDTDAERRSLAGRHRAGRRACRRRSARSTRSTSAAASAAAARCRTGSCRQCRSPSSCPAYR